MSLRSLSLLIGCLLLAACSKLTQENYSKITTGMPRAQVEQLLGTPDKCSGALGVSSCTWGNDQRYVSIQYAADKVVLSTAEGLE